MLKSQIIISFNAFKTLNKIPCGGIEIIYRIFYGKDFLMKSIYRLLAAFSALAFCLSLSACGGTPTLPQDVVSAISSAEIGLPMGMLYHSDAPIGSDEYLPRELLSATYSIPLDYNGIEKAAIRLSGNGHPCEFAVFLCKDGRIADDISLFFTERIRSLSSNALFSSDLCNMMPDEYKTYIENAQICVSGRYVALIISSDPAKAKRTFLQAL